MAVTQKQRELASIFEVPLSLIEAIQKVTGDDKDADKDEKSKKKTDDKDADGQDDKSDKKSPFGKDAKADDEDGDTDEFGKKKTAVGDDDKEEWAPDEGDPNGIGTGETDAEEEAMREKAEEQVAADLAKRYNTSMDKVTMYPSSDGTQFTK